MRNRLGLVSCLDKRLPRGEVVSDSKFIKRLIQSTVSCLSYVDFLFQYTIYGLVLTNNCCPSRVDQLTKVNVIGNVKWFEAHKCIDTDEN